MQTRRDRAAMPPPARAAENGGPFRDVLQSPGEAIDGAAHTALAPLFRHEFSRVRVHADARAGASALAIGARAYTVGRHIVFAPGQYAPETAQGRRLLAHELSHAAPEAAEPAPTDLRVAPYDTARENAAAQTAQHVTRGEPAPPGLLTQARQPAANTVHRELLGTLAGAAGGGLAGAVIGGIFGGPIGALVGGAIGLVAGAVFGSLASTKSRHLTADEIAYAREVFQDSIDYSKIEITRDSLAAVGAPRTLGNTINLKSSWNQFKGDTLELTEYGMTTLIHEMGHVWQYQNGGLEYIPDSLIAQIGATFSGGDRGGAYEWEAQDRAGVPWEKWNPEQQAKAIEDYNKLLRRSKLPDVTLEELAKLARLLPYIEKVRRREGAPGSKPAAAPQAAPGTP